MPRGRSSTRLRPHGGEIHFHWWYDQNAVSRSVNTVCIRPECLPSAGIDDPDIFGSEGQVVVDFLQHGNHGVFRREDLDKKEWRMREDLFVRVASDDRDIGDAESGRTHLHTQRGRESRPSDSRYCSKWKMAWPIIQLWSNMPTLRSTSWPSMYSQSGR